MVMDDVLLLVDCSYTTQSGGRAYKNMFDELPANCQLLTSLSGYSRAELSMEPSFTTVMAKVMREHIKTHKRVVISELCKGLTSQMSHLNIYPFLLTGSSMRSIVLASAPTLVSKLAQANAAPKPTEAPKKDDNWWEAAALFEFMQKAVQQRVLQVGQNHITVDRVAKLIVRRYEIEDVNTAKNVLLVHAQSLCYMIDNPRRKNIQLFASEPIYQELIAGHTLSAAEQRRAEGVELKPRKDYGTLRDGRSGSSNTSDEEDDEKLKASGDEEDEVIPWKENPVTTIPAVHLLPEIGSPSRGGYSSHVSSGSLDGRVHARISRTSGQQMGYAYVFAQRLFNESKSKPCLGRMREISSYELRSVLKEFVGRIHEEASTPFESRLSLELDRKIE